MSGMTDMTNMFKDFMGSVPFETKAFEDAFKNSATLSEKIAGVALTAAGKNADVATKWTKDTLTKMTEISQAKNDPANYAKSISDFASAQAEVAVGNIAEFAEIAKKAQMESVDIMMAASKGVNDEETAEVKKPSNETASAVKKASIK